MIFTERTIRIVNGLCEIDNPIILYRGDFNVEIRFTIIDCPYKYTAKDASNVIETTNASYGQLVIKTPNGDPVFSDVTATNEGAIVFTITGDMIDETIELGEYDFQIRLFDSERTSRATICPVIGGIKIEEPIAIEGGSAVISDTNEVNVARANYAVTTTAAALEAFDSQGNYIETTWADKMLITDARLNKIEDGITGVNQKIANINIPTVPTKTSQLTNDSDFATNASVDEKIANASLGGGSGSVDLTDYAKKTDIPTRVSQLTNDANYVNTTQMNEAIANVTGQTVVEPAELDMPKVFFYGEALPTTKDNVNLTMDYISNTDRFSSYIKLKCQGTSSMSYAKKNFTINMYSDEAREMKLKKNFKGWGAQSKFCLKANWVDSTHTRNISGARIGYDMVASRPDSAFKQQLLTAPRYGLVDGFPIKVYFNGEFHGIYTWNIPKDGWMFNMDESNPNHIVLCAEKNTDGNSSLINSCQFRQLWTNGDGADWSVEFGTMSEDLRTKFNRVIAFVMNATDQEFHDNISEYFDLYSLLDYYCFSYLTCHLDGLAKNMLMITYDGIIWGASLYDMDSIYGVNWNGGNFVATNYQCPEQYQERFSRLWVRIEQCFATELYARYLELRQGALSLSNIIKHVEEIYDVIPDRVFADEKVKWTNIPQVANNTMTRFRNYMRDRAAYVDLEMEAIGTDVACTGITLDKTELALGVLGGSGTDDSSVNYLDGAEWMLGTLNSSGTADSTTDYRCQVTNLPIGTYTLYHETYTYKKVRIKDNDIALAGTNVISNTSTFNITCPNTVVEISVCSNGITPSGVTLTRTNIDTQEYSVDCTTATSPGWASSIDNNYLVLELTIGTTADVDINKVVNARIGDDVYYLPQSQSANSVDVLNTLSNKCNCFIYNGKVLAVVSVLKSKYGSTLAEFKQYCSDNGITNIYINKDIEQGSGTTTKLTEQLTATVEPSNTTDTITWSSNATSIATVNNGLVTAKSNGSAVITATCGSQSATCNVTVSGMSEGGGDEPVTEENLLCYYDSADLTPTSTTWTDKTGNGRDLTITNNRDSDLNITDQGLFLYNVGCRTSGVNIPLTGNFTVEYELTRVDNINAIASYAFNSAVNDSCSYCDSIQNNTYRVNGYCGDTVTDLLLTLNQMYKIRVIYGDSITIYADDVLVGTYDRKSFSANGNYQLCLGTSGDTLSAYFNGRIKSFKLYDGIVEPSTGGGGDTSTYTDVEYIEGSGTQYIDTGVVPTLTTKIEFVADIPFSEQWAHLFGTNNFMKLQWNNSSSVYVIKKNGTGSVELTSGKHTFVMDMTDTTNSITIDGTNYTTTIGNVDSTTYPLLLLSGYSNQGAVETDYCGVGKVYSCKIWENGTLVRDMKPVVSSDREYGLLDTVNNVFYGSEVGSFTGGNEA